MDSPDTTDLRNSTEAEDDFSKAVRYEITRSKTVEKKTYTITLANIDYIEDMAKEKVGIGRYRRYRRPTLT